MLYVTQLMHDKRRSLLPKGVGREWVTFVVKPTLASGYTVKRIFATIAVLIAGIATAALDLSSCLARL
jgi:hypothetical protein